MSEGSASSCSKHVSFFKRLLNVLPLATASMETSRMTIAFFVISGLDLLGHLDELDHQRKQQVIQWIYARQASNYDPEEGGFFGCSFMNVSDHGCERCGCQKKNTHHVAMTYTALASLVILGDDLSRVNRKAIVRSLMTSYRPDGSFNASVEEPEYDMRMVYCSLAVAFIINDWSAINKKATTDFILSCLRYEGGFAQLPHLEAHAGSTYCAVASLSLMGKLDAILPHDKERIIRWCALRLNHGFQGRPNKPDDTCYSFWVGASLAILCPGDWAQELIYKSQAFVLSTADPIVGGLAKMPDLSPDPLHTYLGLSGLSLSRRIEWLCPVNPILNVTERSMERLLLLRDQPSLAEDQ